MLTLNGFQCFQTSDIADHMIFGGFTPCSEIELKFFIGTVNQNHFLKIRAPPVELSPLLLTGQKGRLDLLVQTLSCLFVSTRKGSSL